jgi:hypothetical protein
MIIDDFDVMRLVAAPDEADPPLVVNPDAVLPGSTTLQSLEAVTGRNAKVLQASRRVKVE